MKSSPQSGSLGQERKSFTDDLTQWQKTISATDRNLVKNPIPLNSQNYPPIRKEAKISSSSKVQIQETKAPNAGAEGKFDLEKAMELKERGNTEFKGERFQQAIELYSQSLQLDPRNPVTLANRAVARLKIKDFEGAESDCNAALEVDEKNLKALWRRATARKEQGQFKLSDADIQAALSLDPNNKTLQEEAAKVKEFLGEEGNAEFKLGNYKEALRLYTLTLEKNMRNPHVLTNRAMAHLKLKSFKEAEGDCTRALEIDPKNVRSFWRRATARKELGLFEKSYEDYQAALALDPTNKPLVEEANKVKAMMGKPSAKAPSQKPSTDAHLKEKVVEKGHTAPPETTTHKGNKIVEIEEIPAVTTAAAASNGEKRDPFKIISEATASRGAKPDQKREKKEEKPALEPKEVLFEAKDLAKKPEGVFYGEVKEQPKEGNAPPGSSQPLPAAAEVPQQAAEKKGEKDHELVAMVKNKAAPSNSFEFEKDWKQFKSNDEALYFLFKSIKVDTLPQVLQESLTGEKLSKMIQVVSKQFAERDSPADIMNFLRKLSEVKRFDMNLMMVSKPVKQELSNLLKTLKASHQPSLPEIDQIAKKYTLVIG